MCSTLNIDPLSGPLHPTANSPSSIWSSLLNLSDWTYELSIQIIDISISTLPLNGGLLPLPDLIRRISVLRGIALPPPPRTTNTPTTVAAPVVAGGITEEDIRRAVATLGPLGSGIEIISLPGNRKALRSGAVGGGVGGDEATLIGLAMGKGGRLIPGDVARELGWRVERVRAVLMEEMVERQGVAWVDEQATETEGGREFWISGVVEWAE